MFNLCGVTKCILKFWKPNKLKAMSSKTITILSIICLSILKTGHSNAQTNENNALNSFSFDLYHETKVESENLFLSPLSTYYALLVAYEGSQNKTKKEFEKVLYLKNPSALKNDYLYNLASKSDSGSGFKVSNAIWVDKNLQINGGYKKSVSGKYFSDIMQTDFANKVSTVIDINRWVSDKTNGRIKDIVNEGNINSGTKLMISNAVYFKGEWLNKFEKQKTTSAPFFTSVENQYKVDFMTMIENLQYYENDEYQFIAKPYRDSNLSFCVILPKELFGIQEIEKKINSDFFNNILDSTHSTITSIYIPKLKLESSYMLREPLVKAGLKSAFNNDADFSGITKEKPLWIGDILHKTWIELDEEKTEAAASTSTFMIKGMPPITKVFKADHPFVFFIIDNSTKSILFMGRYVRPTNGGMVEKGSLTNNLKEREKEKFEIGVKTNRALIVLDNKVISSTEMQAINKEDIESFRIYKEKDVIAKYSSEDYDGVLIIKLKKNADLAIQNSTININSRFTLVLHTTDSLNYTCTVKNQEVFNGTINMSDSKSIVSLFESKLKPNEVQGVLTYGMFGDKLSALLVLKSGLNKTLDYDLKIKLTNQSQPVKTSVVSLHNNLPSIEIWPNEIDYVVFSNFKVIGKAGKIDYKGNLIIAYK